MNAEIFPLPQPRTDLGCGVLFILFLGFFLKMAIQNLVNGVGIIASLLFLGLVGGTIAAGLSELGWRRFLVNILGTFSWRHCVWRAAPTTPPSIIPGQDLEFGFEFIGHRFSYLRINAGNIDSISWSPGQATSMAGRDMNDWCVVLWHDDIHGHRRFNRNDQPNLDIYIVGPARSRQETEALGLAFLDFVRAAGATLVETPDPDRPQFVRPKAGVS